MLIILAIKASSHVREPQEKIERGEGRGGGQMHTGRDRDRGG
jgi:hypothetical protein